MRRSVPNRAVFITRAAGCNSGRADGGLNLYAHHPELQMGPVSFLAAGLAR